MAANKSAGKEEKKIRGELVQTENIMIREKERQKEINKADGTTKNGRKRLRRRGRLLFRENRNDDKNRLERTVPAEKKKKKESGRRREEKVSFKIFLRSNNSTSMKGAGIDVKGDDFLMQLAIVTFTKLRTYIPF